MFWNRKPKEVPEETTVMEKAPACAYCAQHFAERNLAAYQAAHYVDRIDGTNVPTCREHHKMYCTGKSIRIILADRPLMKIGEALR